ncbi:hypothetical protein FA15DRAFT_585462 [Coprinopsis marcescibilis]|uniref:Serine aminopeptidase S33 domain-containing protein n=1 Tax=Coprinopsis marcescibilis TaxID=230819 RepID=A0A5C3L5K0_COPMA|nr:hypothetical protein FA15DRAFT_585462 [Coprinopsis marcescibilis]
MNHGEHVDLAEEFLKMGLNVVTMYGNSTGTPSEAGLRIDSQTTLNHLLQHELLSKLPIVLYGQSLGGAVATDLAYKNPGKISALILENTFLSIPILVKDFPAPFRSFPFLCTQKWPSVERIQWIPRETPILMLGGDADMVVRPRHMQGLWAVARERVSLGDLVVEEDERETETEKNALGDGEVPACFPGLGSSLKLRPPTEILKGLEVQYGSVHMRNGKDVFRLFERRTHVNTCRGHEYWPTVRAFLDSNFGLPTSDSGKGSSAPSAAAAAAAAVSTPRTSTSGVHSRPLSSVASSSPVTAIVTVTATTTSAGLGAETAPSSAQVPTSAPST